MKIRNLLLVFSLLVTSLLCAQEESEVELNTETGTLKGSLVIPEAEAKFPVVLIIPGSGPTDRNGNNPMMSNNSLQMLAKGLAEQGIASLRIDKRGIAASGSAVSKEEDLRFETYIDDVVGWAMKLRNDPRFSELIIAGHSEGSLIGMIASERVKAEKFISLAGTGRPAADILREQLSSQPPGVTLMTNPILDSLEMGRTVDNVNPMLNALFRPSVQPYLISWFKYDPAEEIAKLDCPVLILQGTTDIQVQVEDAEFMAAVNPNFRKEILEGMNHVLKEAPADRMENLKTYNDPTLPLKEGLLNILVSFIHQNK